MQNLMDSITAQHFELTNTAKGLTGSNFMYDDSAKAIGITTKVTLDESVSISNMLDHIWKTYDRDNDQTISKDEAREFIEGYLGIYSPSEEEFDEQYF